ncbi:unnamed protein product [Cyclocybe aegerita]|uniref:N-acetyltransferase domain-containing protein n=1 Tax=Cyclocybe aegerita TaxID=1973307 RepID=A0A8S0XIP3_CYCAE|nr:unnamed protein product [Cyclocybe aegerita]
MTNDIDLNGKPTVSQAASAVDGGLYDVNFCFLVPKSIESERLALTPFIPSQHAELFMSQALLYPEVFSFLPFGPFADTHDFMTNLIQARVEKDPGYILFTIYDKTRPTLAKEWPGAIAGIIGLINSSAQNLQTEIGCVIILPPFQRTHVASNAVGLLLHYCLDLPDPASTLVDKPVTIVDGAPLGLRRVCWQANARNMESIRLAERMGFRMEAILHWDRVLPPGKQGNRSALREGEAREGCPGRDTALLSLCWDDWEHERAKVDAIIRRIK